MNRIVPGRETTDSVRYLAIGEAIFDRETRTLRMSGTDHRLEPRLAGVLECLVSDAGIPVTRDQLLDRVWGQDGSDEALTQCISRLRRMLGTGAEIRTLPKIGYVLTADTRPITSPDRLEAGNGHDTGSSARSLPGWAWLVMGALAMAVAGLVVFMLFFGKEREIEIFETTPGTMDAASTGR